MLGKADVAVRGKLNRIQCLKILVKFIGNLASIKVLPLLFWEAQRVAVDCLKQGEKRKKNSISIK